MPPPIGLAELLGEFLGKESAAVGQAGIGYGGSAGRSLDQSAVGAELDALNTRYRGTLTRYGLDTQSGNEKTEGRSAFTSSLLMAGGQLLRARAAYGSGAGGTIPSNAGNGSGVGMYGG